MMRSLGGLLTAKNKCDLENKLRNQRTLNILFT